MRKYSIIECPRDAMQGWPVQIATEEKIEYINQLLKVGFDIIDFGSFVSPKAIPQMADTKEVLANLDLENTNSKLLAIVANKRGADDAKNYDSINYLGFPFSISPTFQQRNTNSTIDEAYAQVAYMQQLCEDNNKHLVVYMSMAFGNPYGDTYNEQILLDTATAVMDMGVKTISLADTVGVASPEQITTALETLIPANKDATIGVHLHTAPYNWIQKLEAAVNANCRRIDAAINGVGGCPMADDTLVGNMDTLNLVSWMDMLQIPHGLNKEALAKATTLANRIFNK